MRRFMIGLAVIAGLFALSGCGPEYQRMRFGEMAQVPGTEGHINLAVIRIEAGSNADLAALEDASQYAGQTPYYVHYAQVGAGAADGDFRAYQGDNQLARLTVPGDFDKCLPGESPTADDQRVEGCMIFLADSGTGRPDRVDLAVDHNYSGARWT
ncbi:hypothetical protein JK358_18810 [Nocardia sp. 2]|uniref:Lipoprotein n=1 Tax=Nocardia acididurans TaxID=2802282 RepID=A0ABS1M736_9NOCA|nr:hypothetical protein [Nocardia acididurans]MBL1076453.1 hypothetical protein [Nocardia acididurans]